MPWGIFLNHCFIPENSVFATEEIERLQGLYPDGISEGNAVAGHFVFVEVDEFMGDNETVKAFDLEQQFMQKLNLLLDGLSTHQFLIT